MIGGGPFELRAGEWTDDTSMALCLAESLINCRAFDARDQMQRYTRWYENGHLSSNGRCFDIGNTTQRSLLKFKSTNEPSSGSTSNQEAGNGCIMRLAPIPMFFASQPELAIHQSGESSRTTHGATMCIDSSRYFGALVVGALSGIAKEDLLAPSYTPVADLWVRQPLCDEVDRIARGSFREKQPPKIRSTGFVIDCLESALWAFHNSFDFREGALKVVNLGGDADTAGAVYGQIAGAF